MQPFPMSVVVPNSNRYRTRTVLVASADGNFRRRMVQTLTDLRWQVREAEGGAAAWSAAEAARPEAVIVDSWLPDLDLEEFLQDFRGQFPQVDVLTTAPLEEKESLRGPYRQELLYALHSFEDMDAAATSNREYEMGWESYSRTAGTDPAGSAGANPGRLPELIGDAPCMAEVSRRVRLVAPRRTPVLIEGPTGSGKEIVARAVHRLSERSHRPFVAINCAAIPEALLEAELFGHARGAFTGAVQGRTGRIEAADGGTLFLDEIGEMPLTVQAKLLRFVESGELQRVGDNNTVKVDVRIVAATHRPLAQMAGESGFRPDLYFRLAVFLIRTPALSAHMSDLPLLTEHFMKRMGQDGPVKWLDEGAKRKLAAHGWPGNVRELQHVLERAAILAGDEPEITTREIDFGMEVN